MANWCFNLVVFQGESQKIIELERLILAAVKKECKEGKGQLFPMVKADGGYLFEIQYENGVLCYMTKWSPNTEVLIALADFLSLSFTHNYEEPGMGIYGQDRYQASKLSEVMLEQEDFEQYELDEGNACFIFQGRPYFEETEILEILLQNKINRFYHPQ